MTKIVLTLIAAICIAGCVQREAVTATTAVGTSVSKIHIIDVVTGLCIRIEEGGMERNEFTRFIVAPMEECRK